MQPAIAIYLRIFLALCLFMPLVWSADALDIDASGKATFREDVAVEKKLTVTDTSAATSTTTGALTVAGGASVQGDVHVGGIVIKQDIGVYATISPTQSVPHGTRLNFANIIADTHNAVTVGSNWTFQAPQSGWYRLSIATHLTSRSSSYVHVFKNGVIDARISQGYNQNMIRGSMDLPLAKNDTIYFVIYSSSGSTHTANGINWVTIVKN